jgi:hypothetical protein
MKKRYAVLGLSVVLALALAVPAFGGPTNPLAKATSSIKKTANKALKTAKAAQTTATAAQAAATAASTEAQAANKEAGKALTEAKKGVTAAAAAQSTANTANGTANSAKTLATESKTLATEAKAAAAAAEANANTRIKESQEIVGEPSAENTTAVKFESAACGPGTVILGGGYFVGGESSKVTVYESTEALYGGGWFAAGSTINGQTANWKITAVAMCGTK